AGDLQQLGADLLHPRGARAPPRCDALAGAGPRRRMAQRRAAEAAQRRRARAAAARGCRCGAPPRLVVGADATRRRPAPHARARALAPARQMARMVRWRHTMLLRETLMFLHLLGAAVWIGGMVTMVVA